MPSEISQTKTVQYHLYVEYIKVNVIKAESKMVTTRG